MRRRAPRGRHGVACIVARISARLVGGAGARAVANVVGAVAVVLGAAAESRAACVSVYDFYCGHPQDAFAVATVVDLRSDDRYVDRADLRIDRVVRGETRLEAEDLVAAVEPQFWIPPVDTFVGHRFLVWLDGDAPTWGRRLDDLDHPHHPAVSASPDDVADAAARPVHGDCVAAMTALGLVEPACDDGGAVEDPGASGCAAMRGDPVLGLAAALAAAGGTRFTRRRRSCDTRRA